jgi:hypothetical protein
VGYDVTLESERERYHRISGKRMPDVKSRSGERQHGARPGGEMHRSRRIVIALVIASVAPIGLGVAAGVFSRARASGPAAVHRAAIVDQLALTDPDPAFVEYATRTLQSAGYVVDYHGRDDVTVDFYRTLPTRGYDLIILRSHSSNQVTVNVDVRRGSTVQHTRIVQRLVGLFTNEPYDKRQHVKEQLAQMVTINSYPQLPDRGSYFGVLPAFIGQSKGKFSGATVILMGCAGLQTDSMARAFLDKGAAHFVSWDDEVTAEHTDAATERLLQHLVGDRLPSREAVSETMAEVGPDPVFGAHLLAVP